MGGCLFNPNRLAISSEWHTRHNMGPDFNLYSQRNGFKHIQRQTDRLTCNKLKYTIKSSWRHGIGSLLGTGDLGVCASYSSSSSSLVVLTPTPHPTQVASSMCICWGWVDVGTEEGKSVHEHQIYCTWMQEGSFIDWKKDEFISVGTW
jgi:hypothetical protein